MPFERLVFSETSQLAIDDSFGPNSFWDFVDNTFSGIAISIIASLLLVGVVCTIACVARYRKKVRLRHQLSAEVNNSHATCTPCTQERGQQMLTVVEFPIISVVLFAAGQVRYGTDAVSEFKFPSFRQPRTDYTQTVLCKQQVLSIQVRGATDEAKSLSIITCLDFKQLLTTTINRLGKKSRKAQRRQPKPTAKTDLEKLEVESMVLSQLSYTPKFDPKHFINPAAED